MIRSLLLAATATGVGLAAPFTLESSASVSPSSYTITTFASELNFPQSMVSLGGGYLLVGTTQQNPNHAGDFGYYLGSGQVQLFHDGNNDGIADGAGLVVGSVPGAVTGIRRVGDLVVVASTWNEVSSNVGHITFLRPGATPTDSYVNVGQIEFAFPHAANNLAMAVRETATPGSYDVYFLVAAQVYSGAPGGNTVLSGLVNADLASGSLYRMTVTPTAGAPIVSSPVALANGIRNTSGIILDSAGNLYFGDNGVEILPSADELNRLDAGSGFANFGYPDGYIHAVTGAVVGTSQLPVTAFTGAAGITPVGIAEIAFGPSGLNNLIVATFYGSGPAGASNTNNPVLLIDPQTGNYVPLVAGGWAGVGHITSVLADGSALYLADFSSTNYYQAGSGVIYRITADAGVPEPSNFALLLTGLMVWQAGRMFRSRR